MYPVFFLLFLHIYHFHSVPLSLVIFRSTV